MFKSQSFGRIFWVDDNDDFKSCPQNIDGTGDFDCEDYVSEWSDWEGVNMETLFNIHQSCVINKNIHNNSLTLEGLPGAVGVDLEASLAAGSPLCRRCCPRSGGRRR